jgi:hypothetical protein
MRRILTGTGNARDLVALEGRPGGDLAIFFGYTRADNHVEAPTPRSVLDR